MYSYYHIFLGLGTLDGSWSFHLVRKAKASTLGVTELAQEEIPFCSAQSYRMCAFEVQYACCSGTLAVGWIHTEKSQCFAIRNSNLSECQIPSDFHLVHLERENRPFHHLSFSLIPPSINFMPWMCQVLTLDIFLALNLTFTFTVLMTSEIIISTAAIECLSQSSNSRNWIFIFFLDNAETLSSSFNGKDCQGKEFPKRSKVKI